MKSIESSEPIINILWTVDRHGRAGAIRIPDETDTEEYKNAFDMIRQLRGVYNSEEEATAAHMPQITRTGSGPDDWYYS